jgi:mRNA-degrading endonuclease RelE of RelBE toxin-antitoxin system
MLLDEIIEKAKKLSPKERQILRNILDELNLPTDPEFDKQWLEVVKVRQAKVLSGQTQTVLLEDVLKELDTPS